MSGPEILHRGDGYTLWHSGVTDGPHGLCLTVEVLDESGTRRMDGEQWRSNTLNRGPIELTAIGPGADLARPHETIEVRSPHYYRLICTFGKYGRAIGPRCGPEELQLNVTCPPARSACRPDQ